MSKYEVKGVKFHRGHEGESLAQCALYCDGVKVALYSDGDWGGPASFSWLDEDAPKVEVVNSVGSKYEVTPEEAKLKEYVKGMYYPEEDWMKGKKLALGMDGYVSKLVGEYEDAKKLARMCKKETLFRLKGDKEGEARVVKAPYSKKVKDFIVAKYGDQVDEILNEKMGQIAA